MSNENANPHRGEHELELGGVTYLLRPSFSAISTIEQKTERTTLELLRMGNAGALPLAIAGTIAAELIRAGADAKDELTKRVSAGKISELIYEHGIGKVVARLTLCLLDAATGGRTAQGEARAVAPNQTEVDATAD